MLGSYLRRYLYFGTLVRLVSSNDAECHVGGSVATGRVFHAVQVKGDDSDNVAHH